MSPNGQGNRLDPTTASSSLIRLLHPLQTELTAWKNEGLMRQWCPIEEADATHIQIKGQRYLNFSSNDYLGLARHPQIIEAVEKGLKRYGVGSTASHAVCGHFEAHEILEQRFAEWVGLPHACLFSSGYQANLAVISTLCGHHDAIFADKLNHACLNDGALLSRAAFHRFKHNDLDHLVRLLEHHPAPRRLIAVDAVYSMDGDCAPLQALLHIAQRHDAFLLVDDAHGLGVLGKGHGSLAHWAIHDDRLIYMGTLGKALGSSGACVAAHSLIIQTLIQKARPYIYTTALPPALALGAVAALDILKAEPERVAHIRHLSQHFRQRMEAVQEGGAWSLPYSDTAIQPLIVYTTERAMALHRALKERGFWVPAIRPPTVPQHSARLRITFSAAHSLEQVDCLVDALVGLLRGHHNEDKKEN
jgi:8-amino-7-oxononanoate synthase